MPVTGRTPCLALRAPRRAPAVPRRASYPRARHCPGAGCGGCTPPVPSSVPGGEAVAILAARPGNWCSGEARPAWARAPADHAEVQVPALWPPVGALDRAAPVPGIAGRDDAVGLQLVQAGAHCALGQPGVADQRGHRRERGGAVRARHGRSRPPLERRSAVLESVLGATLASWNLASSATLACANAPVQATGRLLAHWHMAQFVATTCPCPGRCAWSQAGSRLCLQHRFPGQPSGVANPALPIPRGRLPVSAGGGRMTAT